MRSKSRHKEDIFSVFQVNVVHFIHFKTFCSVISKLYFKVSFRIGPGILVIENLCVLRLEMKRRLNTSTTHLYSWKNKFPYFPFFSPHSCKKQSGPVKYRGMSRISDAHKVRIQEVPHQTLQHTGLLQDDGGLVPAGPDSC